LEVLNVDGRLEVVPVANNDVITNNANNNNAHNNQNDGNHWDDNEQEPQQQQQQRQRQPRQQQNQGNEQGQKVLAYLQHVQQENLQRFELIQAEQQATQA
jgi:hypothetical protein